jgi:hypothetical protein
LHKPLFYDAKRKKAELALHGLKTKGQRIPSTTGFVTTFIYNLGFPVFRVPKKIRQLSRWVKTAMIYADLHTYLVFLVFFHHLLTRRINVFVPMQSSSVVCQKYPTLGWWGPYGAVI